MTYSIQKRLDGRMSTYFKLNEFTRTSTGLPNEPTSAAKTNLLILTQHFLDPIREAVGGWVRVTSGYRSPAVNKAVGGSKTSSHMTGEAADVKAKGHTASELVALIVGLDLPFDQLIAYAPERGGHVHIGIKAGASGRARRQVLWAPKSGGYEPFTIGR
jgi:zinc D-Ala-D-Ala carboxypeptidase